MSDFHHTRVYGGLKKCQPWLEMCARSGFIPDVLFTVGRGFVVATSEHGDLYMRRGPSGPLEVSKDPGIFSSRLYARASDTLSRHFTTVGVPERQVRWKPTAHASEDGKMTNNVS